MIYAINLQFRLVRLGDRDPFNFLTEVPIILTTENYFYLG
jgi:hypothetical protein